MGWVHIASGSLACGVCLPAPRADDGQVGIAAAQRLQLLLDTERAAALGLEPAAAPKPGPRTSRRW